MHVLVYGTLRKGGVFSHALKDALFIEEKLVKGYKLVDLGAYPAAIASKHDYITCERYLIDDEILVALDKIEGYPGLYARDNTNDGMIYVMHPFNPLLHGSKVIECGDWVKYQENRREN